jgi:hypothetical protein
VKLHILAGTTKVADHPELEREAAVLVIEGTALPMVFDDAADTRAFLVWQFGAGWSTDRHLAWQLRDLSLRRRRDTMRQWRKERGWAKCPAHDHPEFPCHSRVRPGADLCESCEGDEDFAAELAAQGATE